VSRVRVDANVNSVDEGEQYHRQQRQRHQGRRLRDRVHGAERLQVVQVEDQVRENRMPG
jgi:hypothetical protein